MKLSKILSPILGIAGTAAVATPLVCLTSCTGEAEEKRMFMVSGANEFEVSEAETNTLSITADTYNASIPVPSDTKVTVVINSLGNNMDIVQCLSTISGTQISMKIGYVTQECTVKEDTDFVTTFRFHFEWTEGGKSYQQTTDQQFKLVYHAKVS